MVGVVDLWLSFVSYFCFLCFIGRFVEDVSGGVLVVDVEVCGCVG